MFNRYTAKFKPILTLAGIAEVVGTSNCQLSLTVVLGKEALKLPLQDWAKSIASNVLIQGRTFRRMVVKTS
jgi:hypothetical protein